MSAVFWFTGLAGAGKSTLAKLYHQEIKAYHPSLLLDGDAMREVIGVQDAYSLEERYSLAFQYARFARMLVQQEIHVIVATISMFDNVRAWNRKAIENYYEIYLRVPMKVLKQRNQKKLYSNTGSNKVVGLDLPFEEPKNPDLILESYGSKTPAQNIAILQTKFSHVYHQSPNLKPS